MPIPSSLSVCPKCQLTLPNKATICDNCNINLRTGQTIDIEVPKRRRGIRPTPWLLLIAVSAAGYWYRDMLIERLPGLDRWFRNEPAPADDSSSSDHWRRQSDNGITEGAPTLDEPISVVLNNEPLRDWHIRGRRLTAKCVQATGTMVILDDGTGRRQAISRSMLGTDDETYLRSRNVGPVIVEHASSITIVAPQHAGQPTDNASRSSDRHERVSCTLCNGNGRLPSPGRKLHTYACPVCRGHGMREIVLSADQTICQACRGMGRIERKAQTFRSSNRYTADRCDQCLGAGMMRR